MYVILAGSTKIYWGIMISFQAASQNIFRNHLKIV